MLKELKELKVKILKKRTVLITFFVLLLFLLSIAYTNSFQYKGEVEGCDYFKHCRGFR